MSCSSSAAAGAPLPPAVEECVSSYLSLVEEWETNARPHAPNASSCDDEGEAERTLPPPNDEKLPEALEDLAAAAAPSSSELSLELLRSLFRPGTRYLGSIKIPGMLESDAQEYELEVVSHERNEAGEEVIVGRHGAYDDEQFVQIYVRAVPMPAPSSSRRRATTTMEIEYSDRETTCRGRWDPDRLRFVGTVRQLVLDEDDEGHHRSSRSFTDSDGSFGDGSDDAEDEVIYTFALAPCTASHPLGLPPSGGRENDEGGGGHATTTMAELRNDLLSPETAAFSERRARTSRLLDDLVDRFDDLKPALELIRTFDGYMPVGGDGEGSTGREWLLRKAYGLPWGDLLVGAELQSERTCHLLRRRAALLDGLRFETAAQRGDVLGKLRSNGLSVASAHEECDARLKRLRDVLGAAARLDALTGGDGPSVLAGMDAGGVGRVVAMSYRLHLNFARLGGSMRRADQRLTEEELARWTKPPRPTAPKLRRSQRLKAMAMRDREEEEEVCVICYVSVEQPMGDDGGDKVKDEAGGTSTLHLPCSHSFHDGCIREWLHNHTRCPVCRFDLRQCEGGVPNHD